MNPLLTVQVGPDRKIFCHALRNVPRPSSSGPFWKLRKNYFSIRNYRPVKNIYIIMYINLYFTDPCFSAPCKNGGTCVNNLENLTFKCTCTDRYQGKTCSDRSKFCPSRFQKRDSYRERKCY